MPALPVRINTRDYNGRVVVESYYGNGSWAVPAWDERGFADLDGPFATAEAAIAACLEEFGVVVPIEAHAG